MIPVQGMVTSIYLTIKASNTTGYSDAAKVVTEQMSISHEELEKPLFYFPVMKAALPELQQVSEEGAIAGWDGFDALPITEETRDVAIAVLEALPGYFPPPSVSAETDGEITFEWYRSPYRVVSVSVGSNGTLTYASLLGDSEANGAESFSGKMPKRIVELVEDVIAA